MTFAFFSSLRMYVMTTSPATARMRRLASPYLPLCPGQNKVRGRLSPDCGQADAPQRSNLNRCRPKIIDSRSLGEGRSAYAADPTCRAAGGGCPALPMHTRNAATAAGERTAAITRIFDPHRSQRRASTANTRRNKSLHAMRRVRLACGLS